ncbi:alkaline phosphatase [Cohnella sp. CIP 111063]|uniref:DedA family protein n=1 Tax=unclassified Cohnella TaxID=2636738 RepID=UPI000B8C1920|nr:MULTISPECIES: DedA family protein [unclassified Cohnella]OXS60538.1 alkaline phosphatase [Cohnella sp. CIP 111063]PRX73002.1 membrane protein DedA with SNARE-associated domain [Cohnella sp. SGD-V74]
MEEIILEILNDYGYVGIFFLIMIENLFPPIPSEVILTFGGFVTTHSNLSLIGVILSATLGSVVGAIILYSLGRVMNANRIEAFVTKWERYLRISPKDIQRAAAWFSKNEKWTVFYCRFIPLIRSLISLPAGMTRMNFTPFLLLTTLGSLIWNAALILVGAYVGESWTSIVKFMDVYSNIAYVGLVLLFLAFLYWYFSKYRRREQKI